MRPLPELALFGSAVLWNICNGMMLLLVPLYALSLGFSILEISSIISAPVLATVLLRFVGGAFSDRFGERRVLQSCYLLNTLSAVMLLRAEGYVSLLLVQAVANLSRFTFWVPAQSIVTQLKGSNVGKLLGQLSACNYGGTLMGQILAGVVVAFMGYYLSFLLLAAMTVVCAALGLALPSVETKPSGRTVWQITLGIARCLRFRHTWLIISASMAAGLPFALTQSIYPVYLAQLNYGEEWIGLSLSLRSVGPVVLGLVFGSWIIPARQQGIYALGMIGVGLFLIGSGLMERFFLLTLCIMALGAAGGVMDLLYQVQASALSKASDRSAALASTGVGWNLAPILLPVIVGWLAEEYGFRLAFQATGTFYVLIGAGTRLWYRLLASENSALSDIVSGRPLTEGRPASME